ncbi:MAG: HAD-IC family P-type ATPase, partial [archaeon]|nr:HAD-IC family P-type ATPase [archaeon]
ISYVKGAPEVILKRCTKEFIHGNVVSLTEKRRLELKAVHEGMASEALRVLGFAFREIGKINQKTAESDLIFVGFQGMLDMPRKEVKTAIGHSLDAGIKVKMITGDSLLTAQAVSKMIGLHGDSVECREMEKMSEEDFDACVRGKVIFARVTPEIKLKIVKSLKKQGEIVAVTGDGVNDILALKEAHIGVAMGIRGTDVAREVSDIILLDDNFSSIVSAVREGRRVYDNMKKSIKFHLAANAGELLLVLCAMIMFLPLPLLPLAILWMNLITDSLPGISLSFEKEDGDIMRRGPLTNSKSSLMFNIWKFTIIAGIILFISAMAVFLLYYESDLAKARTMALTTAVFFEMFIVFVCRSDKNIWKIGLMSNKPLLYAVVLTIVLQLIAIYTPLALVFGFVPLSLTELGLAITASSAGFIFFETMKALKIKI